MIDSHSIENLKSSLDVVEVVSGYIEIKKSGANYKAVCPFHDEKTPSLVISPSKQIFHCFGCGMGGDSIKFVMEYEKLTYPEAIEKLAATHNFTLHYSGKERVQSRLLEQLGEFYKGRLSSMPDALKYLKSRGIYERTIEQFEIGYAPASSESLEFLSSRMFNMNEAVDLGAAARGESGIYARFTQRITFPIYSPNGQIVGFGGRTITDHPAKYINSPQSKVFNKSRLLYAYNLAKKHIYEKRNIIITEGYLDVIMLHQAGFSEAVATLGTALTLDHLPLLRKGEPNVIIAYDGDRAGVEAALKASKMLSAAGIFGGVVLFSNGEDPADMVKNEQTRELKQLFEHPIDFIEFVLDSFVKGYNLNDSRQKQSALNDGRGFLQTLSGALQEESLRKLAQKLGIRPDLVSIKKQSELDASTNSQAHEDIWELSLIKTLLEIPSLIDMVLEYIDVEHFRKHRSEFELLKQERFDEPKLLYVTMTNRFKTFKKEEVKNELRTFLMNHTNQELKAIQAQMSLPFQKKSFIIRTLRERLLQLNRGELVPYESLSNR